MMSGPNRLWRVLREEATELALAALYFGVWCGFLVILKRLILVQYEIEFRGLSVALLFTLVMIKVVIALEKVPLGAWVRNKPLILDVILRTVLCTIGVVAALLLEKAFEARHEYGGFGPSLVRIFQNRDIHHVWANTICVALATLWFNILTVLRRRLGGRQLVLMFFSNPPGEPGTTKKAD
jgi:hypothetical protein